MNLSFSAGLRRPVLFKGRSFPRPRRSANRMSIPIIDIAGSAGERGVAHGNALAESIARFYERWMNLASSGPEPIAERDAVAFAISLLPESRAQAPDLVEEVEGIAEGAGLP